MGLDMYLYRETYTQNWDFEKKEKHYDITVKRGGKECPNIDKKKISYIVEEIAYWRKANAIHKFFVDECGNGIDECQRIEVSSDKLEELVKRCKTILEKSNIKTETIIQKNIIDNTESEETIRIITNPKKYATQLLPTTEGFFFGSTEYDEWYIQDLEKTIEYLEPYLNKDKDDWGVSYYYRASW